MKRLLEALEKLESFYSAGYLILSVYSDGSGYVQKSYRPDERLVEFDNLKDAYKQIRKAIKELSK